jgi:hypothetical protein
MEIEKIKNHYIKVMETLFDIESDIIQIMKSYKIEYTIIPSKGLNVYEKKKILINPKFPLDSRFVTLCKQLAYIYISEIAQKFFKITTSIETDVPKRKDLHPINYTWNCFRHYFFHTQNVDLFLDIFDNWYPLKFVKDGLANYIAFYSCRRWPDPSKYEGCIFNVNLREITIYSKLHPAINTLASIIKELDDLRRYLKTIEETRNGIIKTIIDIYKTKMIEGTDAVHKSHTDKKLEIIIDFLGETLPNTIGYTFIKQLLYQAEILRISISKVIEEILLNPPKLNELNLLKPLLNYYYQRRILQRYLKQ